MFFDEMDSIFRTRGTGISSDVESTTCTQLLSELDGVETLKNATHRRVQPRGPHRPRDPAAGTPRREDQDRATHRRPGQGRHVQVPASRGADPSRRGRLALGRCPGGRRPDDRADRRADVRALERNRFLEVTYASGDKETLYFKDFNSGAMIENIVRRAKKDAIKRLLSKGEKGIKTEDLLTAIRDEFKENEDLPEHHEPRRLGEDLGKKGERIVYVRTLLGDEGDGRQVERVSPGQYLQGRRWPSRRSWAPRRSTASPRSVCRTSILCSPRPRRSRRSRARSGIRWDYEQESPSATREASNRSCHGRSPTRGPGWRTDFLPNGARYYVDHAHPEYSTPECLTSRDLVVHDKAGERILERSLREVASQPPDSPAPSIYKNNSDGKGNFLRDPRELPRRSSDGVRRHRAGPDPVLRVPPGVLRGREAWLRGAGTSGSTDLPVTQRAGLLRDRGGPGDHAEAADHQQRDEPHADPEKYRRLHVIVGDANMCEVAQFLKVGTTAIVLKMIEDRFLPDLSLEGPVRALHDISRSDVQCRGPARRRQATERGAAPMGVLRAREEVRRARGRHPRPARRSSERWRDTLTCSRASPSRSIEEARLGGEVPSPRGLSGTRWIGPRRPEAARDRSPVSRRPPGEGSLLPARTLGQGRSPGGRCGRRARRDGAS